MFGLKRKRLSEEQLKKAESYGEKVGTFLNRNNPVRKANAYIARHRLWVLPGIVLLALTFTLVGLFWRTPNYEVDDEYKGMMMPAKTDTADLSRAISDMATDAQVRLDSVQSILQKDTLTHEDSLYVVSTLVYIEALNESIHQNEESEP